MMLRNQKGFGIINILLTIVVLGILYLYVTKVYFKDPAAGADQETRKALAEQGMNAQNMPGTVQKAQEAVNRANEAIRQQDKEAQDLLNGAQAGGETEKQ